MQAARGTPVDSNDSGPADPRRRLVAHRGAWLLFAVVAAVLYATDQVSKHVAVDRLTGRGDVPVVGEVLQLHLTRNPGAAFSLGTEFTAAISVLAIVATVVVLWVSRRVGGRLWPVALGLLLAGITGNLTDRMLQDPGPFRGHVIDFLMLPNWPIFNVADICINLGAGVVLVQVFRGIQVDGSRVAADEDPGEEPDQPDASDEPDGPDRPDEP